MREWGKRKGKMEKASVILAISGVVFAVGVALGYAYRAKIQAQIDRTKAEAGQVAQKAANEVKDKI